MSQVVVCTDVMSVYLQDLDGPVDGAGRIVESLKRVGLVGICTVAQLLTSWLKVECRVLHLSIS
jgi:hypothetical protein